MPLPPQLGQPGQLPPELQAPQQPQPGVMPEQQDFRQSIGPLTEEGGAAGAFIQ